jgi:ferrous iron transport protein B
MNLSELKPGESAVIRTVGGTGALRQHFLDMGVIPGAQIKLIKFAPMGDPMEFQLHGYELTLRVDDAKQIEGDRTDTSDAASDVSDASPELPPNRYEHPGLGEGGRYHTKAGEHPLPDDAMLTFALAGNQNSGKTTLFNQLTGSNQHVGNFPGRHGRPQNRRDPRLSENRNHRPARHLLDVPLFSAEEIVTRQFRPQ